MTKGRRFRYLLRISVRNVTRFRLQSILVLFAACIGVAGVLVSRGYAEGGRQKILDRFVDLGTNVISITPVQSRAVGGRARTGTIVQTLTDADYRAIKEKIDGISSSSAIVTGSFRIRAGDLTKATAVIGSEPGYFRIKHWSAIEGALFNDDDTRQKARVALLGFTAARDLFGANDPTGARIIIDRVPFTVAGVLSERGQSLDAANEDEQVYVPLPTAMRRLADVNYFGAILFAVRDGASMNRTAEQVRELLHRRHRRFTPTADDFQIQNQSALLDAQLSTFGRLTFLIDWVAVSTLSVAGVGIWGIVWIGLRSRRGEIGARRAIGASRIDILFQFLSEALAGSILGCAAGVATGYTAVRWLDAAVHQPFVFAWRAALWNVAGAGLLFVLSVTFASGRAAQLDPIACLRTE